MGDFGDTSRQNKKAAAAAAQPSHATAGSGSAEKGKEGNGKAGLAALSPRERDILDAIIAGETSKETARRLSLSPRTVEVHRAHILKKLGAKNTADLLRRVLLDQAKS